MYSKRFVIIGAKFINAKTCELFQITNIINNHGERFVTYTDKNGNEETINYWKFLDMPFVPCIS